MKRRRTYGFSLIELLLGLTIFSTSFLMIVSVFPTSVRAMHQGRQILVATHIAQQQMESALAAGFDNLASSTPSTPSIISMVNGSTEVLSFTTQIVVSQVTQNLKEVRCQVSWQESVPGQSTSIVRYVNLSTMVAKL